MHSRQIKSILLNFVLLLLTSYIHAQVTLVLDYKLKTGELDTVPSGKYWTMQLDYAVSSTTGSASGVKIEIPVPDYINDASGFVGTVHAPTSNFVWSGTAGAKKLTITFVDPVAAGSTGTLEFKLRTTNGITPNGTVIHTCATMTATGATPVQKCQDENITARAMFCAAKTFKGGGAVDNPTTYKIAIGFQSGGSGVAPNGSLNISNITLTDTYPAGAEFVSIKMFNEYNNEIPVNYINNGNSITVTIPDYNIEFYNNWFSTSYYVEVTLKYKSSAGFSSGQSVTNNASMTFTPLGGNPITVNNGDNTNGCVSDLIETHTLIDPIIQASLTKGLPWAAQTTVHPNEGLNYIIGFTNMGNVPLENVEIIETVPSQLSVANSALFFRGGRTYLSSVEYQTNLNATWANWTPIGGTMFIPTLGTGEYITKIKFKLASPLQPNTGLSGAEIYFVGNATSTTQNVTNCAEWNSTTAGIPTNRTACNNQITLEPTPTTAKVTFSIYNTNNGCYLPLNLNQLVTMRGRMSASVGYADVKNPTLAMFLPAGFNYIPGSETFVPNTSGITGKPTLTVTPNYGGGTRTLFRWVFPSGTVLPANTTFDVTANIMVGPQLVPGTDYSPDTWFMVGGDNIGIYQAGHSAAITDQYDWDGDGNTTETYTITRTSYTSCTFIVSASASMESIKWVKGLCDTDYSRYPNYGQTVPGGNADYKLIVKNTGNVTMKNIQIIDILPFIGDKGVIDPQPRLTEWTPNLADPIGAPSGITIYYSTSSNPCRDELKAAADPSPFPTGCTTANWTITPPTNITTVKSVKLDFGATTIVAGDSLIFTWPMRAPITAPTNNEIAWNSFGFVATRSDNNQTLLAAEPIKVGIKVKAGAPAYYGNRVWYDTNHDGIQDATEGGVDGVKVKLFKVSSLSATPNPASDELINFTITGNGGYYKFSNLTSGFYYAVFCLTNEYQISPKNTGTNTNDSDGSPTTYLGQTATITAVTELVDTEDDDSWDQGIYCNITPTASSNSPVQEGGTLNLIASGGGSYYWSGPNGWAAIGASVSKTNITLADTGIYSVNIFDLPDGGGCYATLTVRVKSGVNTCNITSSCTSIPVTSCSNVNGGASVSISGELGNTTYLWSTGETTNTLSNKPAGTYSVTVTDDILSGCSTSCKVVIADNTTPPSVVCTPTQPTCSNPQGGSVQANITGGTAPITYIWNNGNSNSSISNLGAGNYSVTVSDNNGCKSNCSTVLSSPTNCCTIQYLGLVISSCNNKGSLTNSSDDEFSFTLNPSGSGIGTTYIVNGLPNSPQIGNYGSPTSFGPYLISNGVLNITIVDYLNNNCTFSGSITPPTSCSICDLQPPSLSVVDNVCPNRTGSIQVIQNCSPTAFEQYSINNGNTWTNIKPLYNSTPRTIFARCVNKLDTTCKSQISKFTTAPKYCPPSTASECSITAAASIDPCNDNKTNDDKSDDFFTFQINATAINEGSSNKFEVVIGADLFTGVGGNVLNTGGTTYGTPITIGQNKIFVANNTTSYQLVIRDINNNNCFQKVEISPVAPCSIAPPRTNCYPVPCIPIQLNKN